MHPLPTKPYITGFKARELTIKKIEITFNIHRNYPNFYWKKYIETCRENFYVSTCCWIILLNAATCSISCKNSNHSLFYPQLNVRGKNKKERLGGLFKGLAKGVDEVLLSGQKVNNWLVFRKDNLWMPNFTLLLNSFVLIRFLICDFCLQAS